MGFFSSIGNFFSSAGKSIGQAASWTGGVLKKGGQVVTSVVSTIAPIVSKIPGLGFVGDLAGGASNFLGGLLADSPEDQANADAPSENVAALAAAIQPETLPLGESENAQALAAARRGKKGFLGIGDGKPGVLGIGTGKNKARKEAEEAATKAGFSAADVKKAGDRAAAWVVATGKWDGNIYGSDLPGDKATSDIPAGGSSDAGGALPWLIGAGLLLLGLK